MGRGYPSANLTPQVPYLHPDTGYAQGCREAQQGPGKHSRGAPLGRKFLNFCY